MDNPLAQDVSRLHGGTGSTERLISLIIRATTRRPYRTQYMDRTHFYFLSVAERVLAPLREERGWGEATHANEALN